MTIFEEYGAFKQTVLDSQQVNKTMFLQNLTHV